MNGRSRWAAALLLAFALALSACGRKGDLRPPDGQEGAYFGQGVYPAPESVVPPGSESSGSESSGGEPEDEPESGTEGAAGP